MRILVTCIFFQSCFSQRLLVARLLIGLFPRLLWAILQPLSPAKIVNTMNLSKNWIQLFILSWRKFFIVFEIFFFLRFSERRFSQNLLVTFLSLFAKLKVQTCWILWKSKIPVLHLCDLRHYLFYLCFSPIFFCFFCESCFFLKDQWLRNVLLMLSWKPLMRNLYLEDLFCSTHSVFFVWNVFTCHL